MTSAPPPETGTGVHRHRAGTHDAANLSYRPPLTTSRSDFVTGGRDDEFREAIYLLVLGLGRLQACREAFGRHLGLTATQFAVLFGTAYRQGSEGVTIRDLASHISLAPTHVTTEVGRLARRGLLVKRPNAQDRRSVLVCLSPEGENAVERVAPLVREVNDLLFQDVSADEFRRVAEFASKLIRNAEYAAAALRAADAGRLPGPR